MSEADLKYRHEFKYVISNAQLPLLKSRISPVMQRDPHVGPDGIYNIRSLYFDDYRNRCFYENENGRPQNNRFRRLMHCVVQEYDYRNLRRHHRRRTEH